MNSATAVYFIRKSGIIMGPYSEARLLEMAQNGTLGPDDAFSADKQLWQSTAELFPHDEEPEKAELVEVEEDEFSLKGADFYALRNRQQEIAPELPEEEPEEKPEEELRTSFAADIPRTIALVWQFRDIFPLIGERSTRIFGIASGINFIIFTAISLFFVRGSSRLFSVAAAWGLLAALGLLSLGGARLMSRQAKSGEWITLGAAYLMDFGMIGGTALAWFAILGEKMIFPVLASFFIAGVVLCCEVIQTQEFSTYETERPFKWAFLTVPALNAIVVTTVYFIAKW